MQFTEMITAISGMLLTAFLFYKLGDVIKTWVQHRGARPTKEMHQIAERLEHMERAIDAMAVEVERISEGQRFTTKLLSDRQAEPALQRRT